MDGQPPTTPFAVPHSGCPAQQLEWHGEEAWDPHPGKAEYRIKAATSEGIVFDAYPQRLRDLLPRRCCYG